MTFINVFLRTLGFLTAVTIFLIIINLMFYLFSNEKPGYQFSKGEIGSNNIIAILELNGPIISNINKSFVGDIYEFIDPNSVKRYLSTLEEINPNALIIKINSPGGTVSASASLEKIINNFKKRNNIDIYFHSSEILASGGYWVATSGDKIYANYGSIIGSIGVSGPDWYYYNNPTSINTGILGKSIDTERGIEVFSQNAGNYKDLYNPFRKPSVTELDHLNKIVQEIYDDFVILVSRSRKIEIDYIKNDVGALIYTSKQAKNNFLIDDEIYYEELINTIIDNEDFDNYQIIENKTNVNILQKYFISFKNEKKIFCDKLNSNFISILPNYLSDC